MRLIRLCPVLVVVLALPSLARAAATLIVTDNLVTHYDAALDTFSNAAGTVASNVGDNVLRWEDQALDIAGNNHVQQQNSGAQPTVAVAGSAEGLNGDHRVIRYDGGDTLLAIDGGSGMANQDPFGDSLDTTTLSWFLVTRQTSGAPDRTLGAQVGTRADQWGSFYGGGDLHGHTRNGGAIQDSVVDLGTRIDNERFAIHSTVWDGSNFVQSFATDAAGNHIAGPKDTDGGDEPGNFARYRIGAGSSAGAPLNGDVAEVLIYNAALSGRDRAKVESYLHEKYFDDGSGVDVVGHWEFAEQPPGTSAAVGSTIVDYAGDHDGLVTGNTLDYVLGDSGHKNYRALRFDGDGETGNDRVVVPDSPDFHFDDAFTIESLIRTTDPGTVGIASKNGQSGANSQWWLRLTSDGQVQFLVKDDAGAQSAVLTDGTEVANTGEWTHVAAVYNEPAELLEVYIDYELVQTASAAGINGLIGNNPDDITFGDFLNGARNLNGEIDFIRISNGALVPAQFLTQYVPEPSSVGLMIFGLAGLLMRRRRRR